VDENHSRGGGQWMAGEGRGREIRDKGREGIGGRGRRMGIAHPLFSA